MFPLETEIENTTVKRPSTNKNIKNAATKILLAEWIKLQLYKERQWPTGPQRKPVCWWSM